MFRFEITDKEVVGGIPQYYDNFNRISSRGIIINNSKQVAMLYLQSNGCYVFPGGGIEEGENAKNTLIREVLEECGLSCRIIDEIGCTIEHKKKVSYCHKANWFIGELVEDTFRTKLSENEIKLGVTPVMIDIEKVSNLLEQSLEKCNDYKRKFIQLRDKMVWDYVYKNYFFKTEYSYEVH